MKAAEDEIELRQRALVHVAQAVGIEVQFDGADDTKLRAGGTQRIVDFADLLRLLLQLRLVDSSGNLQSLGVIGNGDVFVVSLGGGVGHLSNRARAVAPQRMHLQVALDPGQPAGIFGERGARLSDGEKARPDLGR